MFARVSYRPKLLGSSLAVLLVGLLAPMALADDPTPTVWSQATTPAPGPARSIGSYSAGCVRGAQALPLKGPGYEVKRPERRRHFGHPALIEYITKLGERIEKTGLSCLAVGDLGQVRGGPAPNGHASHQTGLDVDLWFVPADASDQEAVVDLSTNRPTKTWTDRVPQLLRLAASDEHVARIFVNPAIKQQLCDTVQGDREWLSKLRPWYGHHEHFHVRLECPKDSPACESQAPIPPGDGCGELAWWLSEATKKERTQGVKKYGKRVGARPQLPKQCDEVAK